MEDHRTAAPRTLLEQIVMMDSRADVPSSEESAHSDTPLDDPSPLPITPPPPFSIEAAPGGGLTSVHQFHSGSAVNDAITNSLLLTRGLLRSMGYHSEIFTEQPPEALSGALRTMEQLPRHDRYVLLVHHSMGYDRFQQILDLPAPKVLVYHNITPPELLVRHPHLARYAQIGRTQLRAFRGRVAAALAVSEYNAGELRRLGLAPIRACNLLFDLDALRTRAGSVARAPAAPRQEGVFTILFVGRINESKGQVALVDAYACFRETYGAPSRLVLVGRAERKDDPYAVQLRRHVDDAGLADHVTLTGGVSDAALDGWYSAADLYVSLSRHEGFGVPLVEAMVHGVPVLAYPGGAVPYTLAGAARLLTDLDARSVAGAMLELASDGAARDAQRTAQTCSLDRFALSLQTPVLLHALLRAGAALPADAATPGLLAANLQFSVTGHVNGSYSLAAVNRGLALALDSARPGRVRLLPVEGAPTLDLSGVPEAQAAPVFRLAHRPQHPTGPVMAISQHYPVHVPGPGADLAVALLFWEESRLPAETISLLGRHFDAVVAPTRFVRDALIESGLAIPARVILPAMELQPYTALRQARDGRAPAPVHRFLHVSSCFPRKGVDVLLRAWARAFRSTDPVRLVIKGFPNPHNTVAAMLEALRASDPGLAPVTLIDRDLDGTGLLTLYDDADTMVLPTRGEGLNLPAAEALAAGLGLIVTGAGGHMDFCTTSSPHAPDRPGAALPGVRLLRFRQAPSGSHLATPHSRWLEPDEDDLVDALRERLGAPPVASELPAFAGAETIAGAYTDLALDLLLAEPRGPVRVSWISSWAVRCGVAEYSRQLLGGLPRDDDGGHGLQVRVLCDRRTAPDPDDRTAAWPCWNAGNRRTVAPIAAAIAADDAQAVMVQHQPGLFLFSELADLIVDPAMAGRVSLVTLHNTVDLLDLPPRELSRVVDALHRVDRVLVHTMADLDRLDRFGLSATTTLLPHGVPAALPRPPIRSSTMPGAIDPLIGCYGFFLPGKGIDVLIRALAVLRRRWPGARLVLVNAEYDHPISREEIARCSALIESLGLAGAVRLETEFMPNHDSLDLLAACDVVALPYLPSKEASSAALRGALAAGAPVAVTPIALFDEAGDAVFRFDGHTDAAVAEGLDRLLGDAALRARIQDTAQTWMDQRRWTDIARLLEGMIAGLVRSKAIRRDRAG